MKYDEFQPYRIQQIANSSGLESLLSYSANNVKINHLLVKLFHANMNLDHHHPHNRENCIWTWVCGVKIYLPLVRLGDILQCPSSGTDLDDIDASLSLKNRDEVSHRFLSDDITRLTSVQLRPQSRILHRALIRSVLPRTESYEVINKCNFQALYAIYSEQSINWGRVILEEFMDVNRRRRYKTFHYGAYIMKILRNYGVTFPELEFSPIKELGSKTLGLMNLPKRPQNLNFISFQQWITNRDQNIPQPP